MIPSQRRGNQCSFKLYADVILGIQNSLCLSINLPNVRMWGMAGQRKMGEHAPS